MPDIQKLPSFTSTDQEGNEVNTQNLLGKPLVMFFYPKNFTPGCTAEVCSFRDAFKDFEDIGATVIGISRDDVDSHQKFIEKHNLPFQLISDPKKNLQKLFGVKSDLFGLIPGRETFVFDRKGNLIHRFKSQVKVEEHVAQAIDSIRKSEENY